MDTASRGTLRTQLTKLTNAAQEYLASSESQVKADANLETIIEECSVFTQRISTVRANLVQANTAVSATIKPEDLQRDSEAMADYEDKAVSALSRLDYRLKRASSLLVTESNIEISNNVSSVRPQMSIQLPKLSLKSFSGKYLDWIPFWECFRKAVHEATNLSGAEKFNYLQHHLSGRAAESIAGFIPSEENYSAAISLLQEEYGDKEKLIEHTMQKLMALPNITNRHDVNSLRKLYNDVTTHTRSLTVLGVPVTHYSIVLKTLVLKVMPRELVTDLHRSCDLASSSKFSEEAEDESMIDNASSTLSCSGDCHLHKILKFLKSEVESLERTALSQPQIQPLTKRSSHTNIGSAAGLMASNETKNQYCCFCKSVAHLSQDCNGELMLSQRKDMLKKEGRCFKCTKKGHSARQCRQSLKCKKCNNRHATAMCNPEYSRARRIDNTDNEKFTKDRNATNLCSVNCSSQTVYLQTLRAIILNSTKQNNLTVRIILDGGSQRTYVSENTLQKLGITNYFDVIKLRILPFGSSRNASPKEFKRVKLSVKSIFDDKMISIIAVVVPHICVDVLPVPTENCTLFAGLELADNERYAVQEAGLSILIGADYYWSIVTDNHKRLTANIVASETILGWTIQGPVPAYNSDCHSICASVFDSIDLTQFDLTQFWSLETIGICNPQEPEKCIKADDFVRKIGDRYEAKLLWRANDCLLDDNKNGALVRLKKLINKLRLEPTSLLEYDRLMQEMLSSGVAEAVSDQNLISNKTFYLPHRPVYRYDKTTTKVRIVFDASAHATNALSLNDNLLQGPNLFPDILDLLLNFRVGLVAMVADVEKAFLQILLHEDERDVHRFIWFENKIQNLNLLPQLREFRMTRVTFGVACSPYLLCATLRKHFNDFSHMFPETCSILLRSFYMDDFLTSTNNIQSAIKLFTETCEIMNYAKMNIRKWNSNDERFQKLFKEAGEIPSSQKVLGVLWCCQNDTLMVDLSQISEISQTNATKRSVLSFMARVYDPLGILGNLIIGLKILLQDIWRLKLEWDEPLPPNLQTKWNKSIYGFKTFGQVSLARCFFSEGDVYDVQLHVFADASPKAYGCVAYLRTVYSHESICVSFICSRNRVAPLKSKQADELTLPKLELTASLIASRLTDYLHRKLKLQISKTFLWSDSKIVLAWIHNNNQRYKPFIENRVVEIRNLTQTYVWSHCPGTCNPADVLTREYDGRKQKQSLLLGPEWLRQSSDNWMNIDFSSNYSNAFLSLQVEHPVDTNPAIFALERFSRYSKILRVTAYIFRFVHIKQMSSVKGDLISKEILKAEIYWIKYIQSQHFSEEFKCLHANKRLHASSSILLLRPLVDENGLLRVGSRLQESGYDYDEIYPVILPKSSFFSMLLVRHIHEKSCHGGVNLTLSTLRAKYWIIKARQLVKAIIKRCVYCKKFRGVPASQPFAPLPRCRIQLTRPFETTGIDFAGPLYGKIAERDSDTHKFYIMILTCAVVRSVHLELVSNLTTKECLNALRRFFARRGIPSKIISDNAKTFRRAALEFRSLGVILESSAVQEFACSRRIHWDFIVERAAWWGGFWERLIKIIKDNLKLAIGKALLTVKELETFLCEAEAIVNSRPLTYISDDPEDLLPLTPNNFLSVNVPLEFTIQDGSLTDNVLRKAWLTRFRIINKFKKRFKLEYLHRLRSAHYQNSTTSSEINIGDVVLVFDQLSPRSFWKLARITNVFPGRDGLVRACELKFANNFITRRPIQHIYPLELTNSIARPEDVKNCSNNVM